MKKRLFGFLGVLLTVLAPPMLAQGTWTPFGLDMELIPNCSISSCPQLDSAVAADSQWVRIFVPWAKVEPTQPSGPVYPSVNGQMSGQHNYDWTYPDAMIPAALNRGLNVLVQIYWTAPWANYNQYPNCNPVSAAAAGQCWLTYTQQQCGKDHTLCYAVGNPQGAIPWFYLNIGGNIVQASVALQDFAYNLAARYPGVQSFSPMNEPNFPQNYDPPGGYSGNYLNYFMQYYVAPVSAGIKAANATNKLVGPDVTLSANGSTGRDQFMVPLNQYFSSWFDVWSVHSYRGAETDVRADMDDLHGFLNKPIWLTEVGWPFNYAQSNNVYWLYVDCFNRQSWWQKAFYHQLQAADADDDKGLVAMDGVARDAYYTYVNTYPR
jgi:hypothetical protein